MKKRNMKIWMYLHDIITFLLLCFGGKAFGENVYCFVKYVLFLESILKFSFLRRIF